MRTLSRIWSPLMASTSSSTVAGTTTSTLPTFNPSPGLTFSLSCILWPTLLKGAKQIDFFLCGYLCFKPLPVWGIETRKKKNNNVFFFFVGWGYNCESQWHWCSRNVCAIGICFNVWHLCVMWVQARRMGRDNKIFCTWEIQLKVALKMWEKGQGRGGIQL